jgi:hypothetical protein
MWTCDKCGQKFVNRNQSHSCGNFSVSKFLKGKSPKSVELFKAFVQAYEEVGVFELHPVKTRVALLTLMRFAAINKLGKDFIDGHLVLVESHDDECFRRIENLNDRFFVHHFRLYDVKDLTRIKPYMKLAYQVGQRKHLRSVQG